VLVKKRTLMMVCDFAVDGILSSQEYARNMLRFSIVEWKSCKGVAHR
jgi:hypothetical protein